MSNRWHSVNTVCTVCRVRLTNSGDSRICDLRVRVAVQLNFLAFILAIKKKQLVYCQGPAPTTVRVANFNS